MVRNEDPEPRSRYFPLRWSGMEPAVLDIYSDPTRSIMIFLIPLKGAINVKGVAGHSSMCDIPALGRPRQEDREFEAFVEILHLTQNTIQPIQAK